MEILKQLNYYSVCHEELNIEQIQEGIDEIKKYLELNEIEQLLNNFTEIKFDETNIYKYVEFVDMWGLYELKYMFSNYIVENFVIQCKFLEQIYKFVYIQDAVRNLCKYAKSNILTDMILIYINKFVLIHELNACNNKKITDNGIRNLSLHILDASNNENITDKGIKNLQLHTLNATWNNKITNRGIKNMQLKRLYVICNTQITDEGIRYMELDMVYRGNDKYIRNKYKNIIKLITEL